MREYWKTRPKATKYNPAWRTPEQLWDEATRYFDWATDNPLYEERLTNGGKKVNVQKMRAMTLGGLCAFLGVNYSTFKAYEGKPEFAHITEGIRQVISTIKFEGAAAGLLQATIIARDLGLADKQELTGKDGGAIETRDTTYDELRSEARRLGIPLEALGLADTGEEE